MAISVVNVRGSRGNAMDVCGCAAWIDHWRTFTGSQRSTCMAIGCLNEAVHGAHVRGHQSREIFVIGLCARHNHPSRTDPFDVDERSAWAPDGYVPGSCGVIHLLRPGDVVVRTPAATEKYELHELIQWIEPDMATWWVFDSNGRKIRVKLSGRTVRVMEMAND